MKKRTRTIIGWICAGLVGALTLMSAVIDIMPMTDPTSVQMAQDLGILDIAVILGVAKLVLLALYLIPRTSTVGFVLLIGYFGGALATNITHHMAFGLYAPLLVVFLLMTIGAYFRNPELLFRLQGKKI
jgi:hypothetical protein